MHIPKLLRSFTLRASLCLAALLPGTSAQATVTVLHYYRMGENDAGAAPGGEATSTTDVAGSRVLNAVNAPVYSDDVAPAAAARGSSLSLYFSGSNAMSSPFYLSNATDNFGLEAWVKPTTDVGTHCVAYSGNTGGNGWGIFQLGNTFQVLYGGLAIFGNAPVTVNQWTHLALVRASGTATLYMNGAPAGSSSNIAPNPVVAPGGFGVAVSPTAFNAEFFQGYVDDVRFFTFAAGQFSTNDLESAPIMTLEYPVSTPLPAGNVAAWGLNTSGQTNVPVGLTSIQSLAAGYGHNLALRSNGTVVAWGNNSFGEINVPAGLSSVTAIAAGGHFSVALKSDGTVAAWGDNQVGQLAIPVGLNGVTAIAAGNVHTLARKSDGTVIAWGDNSSGQIAVPAGLTGVVAVAGGTGHSLALKNNGTVVAWGSNTFGESTVPAGLNGVVAIAGGGFFSVALKSDGTVVAWGYNFRGRTDVPAGLTGVVAISAGYEHALALKSDGTVVAWGSNINGKSTIPAGLANVTAIAAGTEHSVVVAGFTVPIGTQAVGSTSAPKTFKIRNTGATPLSIASISVTGGNASDFAVNTTGMLTSVPANFGQTTFGVTFTPSASGVRKTTLRVVSSDPDKATYDVVLSGTGINPEIAVFNGASTSPADARTSGVGTVAFANAIVGGNSPAQTFTIKSAGIDDLTGLVVTVTGANPNDFVVSPVGATSLAPNATTTFSVLFTPTARGARNAVVAIASNDADENPFTINVSGTGAAPQIVIEQQPGVPLSTGTVVAWGNTFGGALTVPAGLKGVRAIAAGSSHNVAVRNNGSLFAWGASAPGTNVPGWERDIQAVAANLDYSMGLRGDGTVVVWGTPSGNQLTLPAGLTGVQAISAGRSFALALKSNGTIAAWGTNTDGLSTVPPALAAGVQAISAGVDHALALKSDGTVVAWGSDLYGRATVPPGLNGVQAIAAGGLHSVAVKNDGTFAAWGDNSEGELNVPAGLTGVVALSAGSRHTLALKSDHTIAAWGGNSAGQATVPAGLTGVRAISAGAFHSLALVDSTVDYGNQSIGITSVKKTFTIKNTGLDTLNITSVSVVGTNAADFSVGTNGMSGTLQAGIGTTAFAVYFTPSVVGYRTATLRVLSDAGDESIFDIALTGIGIAPEVAVFTGASTAPADELTDGTAIHNFAGVLVGGSSAAQTFTIRNAGPGDLAISAVDIAGANPGDFIIGTPAVTLLPPNTTATFTVTFTPTAAGSRGAVVSIASNDPDENPFEINVTGTGLFGQFVLEQPAGSPRQSGGVIAWGTGAVPPAGLTGVKTIAAGGGHGLALMKNGTVTAWGANGSGQANVPSGLSSVTGIAAGSSHSLAVTSTGNIVGWGDNSYGKALDAPGSLAGVTASVAAGFGHSLALKNDGTVIAWGDHSSGQSTVPGTLTGVTAIAAGQVHSAALKSTGGVVVWGPNNGLGLLNIPGAATNSVVAISAGGLFMEALRVDGTVVGWGSNDSGQLFPPAVLNNNFTAVSAGYNHTLGLKRDGTVLAWGDNFLHQTEVPAGLRGVTGIAAGSNFSLALVSDSIDFGNQPASSAAAPLTFTIKNPGTGNLLLGAPTVTGAQPGDFAVSAPVTSTIAAGGGTTFTVTFTPGAVGPRSAKLQIPSSDPNATPFILFLYGTGTTPLTALEAWRLQYFGSIANSGNGANLFDFDGDGLTNLIEFAFGLNPTTPHNPLSPLENFPQAQLSGGNLTYSFSTPAGVSGITYGAEWTTTLQPDDWHSIPDTGSGAQHIFAISTAGKSKLFTRLVITTP